MKRATHHARAGAWPAATAAGAVTLDFDARHRRRIRLATDAGEALLLDLAEAVAMAEGDGLALEDGRWIAVRAAPEPVVEIRGADATHLARLAWHLGNRHLATEVGDSVLCIRPDHVIEEMLVGLGARLLHVTVPFQPEGGAYETHAHGHEHEHEHDHEHGHRHA